MTYPKIRISLVTAQYIFKEANIQTECDDNGKIILYKGKARSGTLMIDKRLSSLCKRLWEDVSI